MPVRKDPEVVIDLIRSGRHNYRDLELTYGDENYLTVKSTMNGVPVNLTELGAATASLAVRRFDRTEREVAGTITEAGHALFILDGDSLEVPGAVEATAQYYAANGDRISSARFVFKALDDPSEGAAAQVSEQSTIQRVLGEGPQILADAETKILEMDEAVTTTKVDRKGMLANDAALAALTGAQVGDVYTILNSASNGGLSRTVRYDGTQWVTTDLQDPTAINTLAVQLAEKANGNVYRAETNPSSPNVVMGYQGNDIASDVHGSIILGGGTLGNENIIGGNPSTVGTTNPNVANLTGSGASVAVIGGGYDNVNNALAGVLTGFHCIIDQGATHGTISGGSFHRIFSGDYSTIAGGTKNTSTGIHNTIGGGIENQAAEDSATVAGGNKNKATGKFSNVAGGLQNEATAERASVGGGYLNKSTGYGATIGGGYQNEAKAVASTIGGGEKNIINTGVGGTIVGGSNNTSDGNYATIVGGYLNVNTGARALILGGQNNKTTADYASVVGGELNEATATHSIAMGKQAKTRFAGQRAISSGAFLTVGDAQISDVQIKAKTTDATTTTMLNGAGGAPSLQTNSTVGFTVKVTARRTDVVGEQKFFIIEGIANKNGASNVAITAGTPREFGTPTWTVTFLGGGSTFNVRVTGEAGKTIQWVAKVEFVENVG